MEINRWSSDANTTGSFGKKNMRPGCCAGNVCSSGFRRPCRGGCIWKPVVRWFHHRLISGNPPGWPAPVTPCTRLNRFSPHFSHSGGKPRL